MKTMTREELNSRRRGILLLDDGREVRTDDDAAAWIDARGFAPLARQDRCCLPGVSDADVGGGSWEVSDAAWRWKETLPGTRACLYTKFFRGGGTFISWEYLPHFLSLYSTGRSPAEDYQNGLLSRMEKRILDIIGEEGPLDSRQLWRRVREDFPGPRGRFLTALTQLQKGFRLTVCGGSLEGWSLHRWDLLIRQAPADILDGLPLPAESRERLLEKYVENAVACPAGEPGRLFGWDRPKVAAAVEALVNRRAVVSGVEVEGIDGPALVMAGQSPARRRS